MSNNKRFSCVFIIFSIRIFVTHGIIAVVIMAERFFILGDDGTFHFAKRALVD